MLPDKEVQFETTFGEDNPLLVTAGVVFGLPEHSGATVAPEDAYPAEPDEIVSLECWLLEGNSKVPFNPIDVAIWDHTYRTWTPLEAILHTQALDEAHND